MSGRSAGFLTGALVIALRLLVALACVAGIAGLVWALVPDLMKAGVFVAFTAPLVAAVAGWWFIDDLLFVRFARRRRQLRASRERAEFDGVFR